MKNPYLSKRVSFLSRTALSGFVKGISKLVIKFNINIHDLFESIKIEVVKNIYDSNQKIYETSLLTGIDHRTVSKIIKNNYSSKSFKGPKMEMIIIQELKKSSLHCENKMIPKKGDLNSLDTILKKHGFSYVRTKTIIEVLLARGIIEDYKNHIKFLGNSYKNKQSNEDYFMNVSRSINWYSDTVIFNKNELIKNKQGLYEQSIYSTQIHPKFHSEIELFLFHKCREFNKEVDEYLSSFETHSPGTFNYIGISVLQFNSNREQKNE